MGKNGGMNPRHPGQHRNPHGHRSGGMSRIKPCGGSRVRIHLIHGTILVCHHRLRHIIGIIPVKGGAGHCHIKLKYQNTYENAPVKKGKNQGAAAHSLVHATNQGHRPAFLSQAPYQNHNRPHRQQGGHNQIQEHQHGNIRLPQYQRNGKKLKDRQHHKETREILHSRRPFFHGHAAHRKHLAGHKVVNHDNGSGDNFRSRVNQTVAKTSHPCKAVKDRLHKYPDNEGIQAHANET